MISRNYQQKQHNLKSHLGQFSKFMIISFTLTEMVLGLTVHKVGQKQTLSNITYEKYGFPVYGRKGKLKEIIALNPHILNPNRIKPGDVIYLPNIDADVALKEIDVDRAPSFIQSEPVEIGKLILRTGTGGIEIQQYDETSKLTSRVISRSAYFLTLGMDQTWSENSQFNLAWDLAKIDFEQPEGVGLSETSFLMSKFSGAYSQKISNKLKLGLKTEFAQLPQLDRKNASRAKIETPWVPVISPALNFNHQINRYYAAGFDTTVGYVLPALISSSETHSGYGYELKPYISMSLKKLQVWTEAALIDRNFSNSDSEIQVQELQFMVGIKFPILGD